MPKPAEIEAAIAVQLPLEGAIARAGAFPGIGGIPAQPRILEATAAATRLSEVSAIGGERPGRADRPRARRDTDELNPPRFDDPGDRRTQASVPRPAMGAALFPTMYASSNGSDESEAGP